MVELSGVVREFLENLTVIHKRDRVLPVDHLIEKKLTMSIAVDSTYPSIRSQIALKVSTI